MRRHLLTASALAVAFTAGVTLTSSGPSVEATCYEDSVLVWSGETNSHSTCIPIDDYVDLIEPWSH